MEKPEPTPRSVASAHDPRRVTIFLLLLAAALLASPRLDAQSLRPSRQSLDRQNRMAREHSFTFLRNEHEVQRMVEAGVLVPVEPTERLSLKEVSYPWARPEVAAFLTQLSERYAGACGEPLVVTSLTRPQNHQPANASRRSVHPTGMAFDLRRSWSRACRSWLDATLLGLEAEGVLEAAVEHRPLHYHIALFPRQYEAFLERGQGEAGELRTHLVLAGESLWQIASRYNTSVELLRAANGLRSSVIKPGLRLVVPGPPASLLAAGRVRPDGETASLAGAH